MKKHPFNVAILGFGVSASVFHLPLISAINGFKVTHILSNKQDLKLENHPDINIVNNLFEIINNDSIDLIINTLPNNLHFSTTKECLEFNKNVIVEKPFTITSNEANILIQLAKKKGSLLSIFHNRRWDNGYLTLQDNIIKLGKIYLYEAYFDRYRPEVNFNKWKECSLLGSGTLYDLGSHLIDQVLNLFGMPQKIFADLEKQRNNTQTIDFFQVTMWYDEMRVIIGSSSLMTSPRPTIAVYGDKASYVKYGLDVQENNLRLLKSPRDLDFGVENSAFNGKLTINKDNSQSRINITSHKGSYISYYQGIYDTLLDCTKVSPVSPESALNVITIIEAAIKSNMAGKEIHLV